MHQIPLLYVSLVTVLTITAGLFHLLPRLGKTGQNISDWFCYAPGIDLALAYFMLLPIGVATINKGWLGLPIALLAELTALWIWIIAHELTHYKLLRQAKIHRTLGQVVGNWQNHLAVWITSLAIPLFWMVRLTQVTVYPFLIKLINLPKYNQKEWVNVSRHKFEGLVGYDLIWCLYCDWMTGVWSLGSEMLRNVESFWCPIRFYSEKKCENCQVDFPDLSDGWVAANGTIEEVTELIKLKYTPVQQERAWFGHTSRNREQPSDNGAQENTPNLDTSDLVEQENFSSISAKDSD